MIVEGKLFTGISIDDVTNFTLFYSPAPLSVLYGVAELSSSRSLNFCSASAMFLPVEVRNQPSI